MKKALFLFIVMFGMLAEVQAQMAVYVKSQKEGKPLRGVIVYSFSIKKDAKRAFDEMKREDNFSKKFDEKKYGLIESKKTDATGMCLINVPSWGAIILDGGDCSDIHNLGIYEIDKYLDNELDNDVELILDTLVLDKKEKERTLGTVPVTARQSMRGPGGRVPRHNVDYVPIEKEIDIFGELARDDVRFVAMPTIHFLDPFSIEAKNSGRITKLLVQIGDSVNIGDVILHTGADTVRTDTKGVVIEILCQEGDTVNADKPLVKLKSAERSLPPVVVDGKGYRRSMLRRMSFSSSRDKLDEFLYDRGTCLQDHQSERIFYSENAKITKGTRYRVPGVLWYEDYNSVFHEDSILFSDGTECEPMRFLNWDDAREQSPIDRELFYIPGMAEKMNDSTDFKIKFESSKENLNLSDSSTVSERDNMIQWLEQYYNLTEGELNNIEVLGYSSPDGTEANNRRLSRARSKTIEKLLKSHFPDVRISFPLDKYDNIVPWTTVADTMSMMADTLAHVYADEIRKIVADKSGFDAQNNAIKSLRPDIDTYVRKHHVLDKVRIVRVKASIITKKILSREDVVARYESDVKFRKGKILPYQFYYLICHFADMEDWDELYTISQRAYKEAPHSTCMKQFVHPTEKDSAGNHRLLPPKDYPVPYPLAAYYYAVSSIRKGIVDKDILRPYLDDGFVGDERKNDPVMNSLPFLVAQVLMYCQGEDFEGANKLIEKYSLMNNPDLYGLIMFVKCLGGHYHSSSKGYQEVRDYVMASSPMNKAVMLAALDRYKEAIEVLYGEGIPDSSSKVEYLRAICLFNNQPDAVTDSETESLLSSALYEPDFDDLENSNKKSIPTAYAIPMLNAIRLDEKNLEYLQKDGYFNNAYRQMVLYAWKRMQSGIPLDKIALEYQALVRQMRENKKNMLQIAQ